jgi:uncharacterized protein (TIGR02996 family)
MDTLDRHLLTLAMLRGDRAARLVLADLLDEQGDMGLANFARRARMSGDADLDLALHMLDSRQVVAIGCEFVGRHATDGLAVLIDQIRHACHSGESAGKLNRLHHRLLRHSSDGRFLWPAERLFRDACQSLAIAAGCLTGLVKSGSSDDEEDSLPELRQECVTSVAVSARQMRESRGGARRRELAWQLQAVSRSLQPLIAVK